LSHCPTIVINDIIIALYFCIQRYFVGVNIGGGAVCGVDWTYGNGEEYCFPRDTTNVGRNTERQLTGCFKNSIKLILAKAFEIVPSFRSGPTVNFYTPTKQ
jgi:hypothetical protein